jgi:hypothetical protein
VAQPVRRWRQAPGPSDERVGLTRLKEPEMARKNDERNIHADER